MEKISLALLFCLTTTNMFSQHQEVAAKYDWESVESIRVYYFPDSGCMHCSDELLLELVENSKTPLTCEWNQLLMLLKEARVPDMDVAIEERCIGMEVDFGSETIPFSVQAKQGILVDLREDKFNFYWISEADRFNQEIKNCLKKNVL